MRFIVTTLPQLKTAVELISSGDRLSLHFENGAIFAIRVRDGGLFVHELVGFTPSLPAGRTVHDLMDGQPRPR